MGPVPYQMAARLGTIVLKKSRFGQHALNIQHCSSLMGFRLEFAIGHTGANFHLWADCCDCADDLAYPKKKANLYPSSSASDSIIWMYGGTRKAFRTIRAEYDDLPR